MKKIKKERDYLRLLFTKSVNFKMAFLAERKIKIIV